MLEVDTLIKFLSRALVSSPIQLPFDNSHRYIFPEVNIIKKTLLLSFKNLERLKDLVPTLTFFEHSRYKTY